MQDQGCRLYYPDLQQIVHLDINELLYHSNLLEVQDIAAKKQYILY